MIGNEVKFTSLCRVNEPYNDNKFNLYRIADIEKGCLYKPLKSNRATNCFENRDWIYKKDGPSTVGSIGVWEWESIPNQNNPSSDYVQSYYVSNLTPVRVVITNASTLEDLINQLHDGTVRSFPYFCDTLFGYLTSDGLLIGILCKTKDFQIIDHSVKINDDIFAFPYYSFTKDDIFYSDDINLCFLKNLQIGDPIDYIAIGNTDNIIKTLVLERSTWPLFKECIGATKAEWRHSKMLLEKICTNSLYDIVSQKLKCSLERAQQLVDDFSCRANELIETGDIDVETVAQIAMRHDGLRVLCEESLFQKWKESHESEIAKATNELILLQNEALHQQNLAQQRLLEVQNEISLAITEKENLLSEISKSKDKLNKLTIDIEEYETLGRETEIAVQKRIEDARKNMAGFIAEISPFLQQSTSQPISNDSYSSWTYTEASDQLYSNEEPELATSFRFVNRNIQNRRRKVRDQRGTRRPFP